MQKTIARVETPPTPTGPVRTACPLCGFDRASFDCCGDPVPSRAQAEAEFWSGDLPDITFGGSR